MIVISTAGIRGADRQAWHQADLRPELLLSECDDQARRRSIRRVKAAGLPRDKWLTGFDFDFDANPNINAATVHTPAGAAGSLPGFV